MSVPESIWIAGMLDECGSYYSEPVEAEGECGGIAVEYIRADLVDPAAIREAAIREAASVAYMVCAETRHVTLGQKSENAILALIDNPAPDHSAAPGNMIDKEGAEA